MIEWLKNMYGKANSQEAVTAPSVERLEVVPVQSLNVVLSRPFIDKDALSAVNLGYGFWAMTPQGVGIVTGCQDGAAVDVTLIKPDGLTKMVLNEQDKAVNAVYHGLLINVRRAYIDEIPNRNPDVEDYDSHMRKFGYIHSSEAVK
jgi:hypothetical protein